MKHTLYERWYGAVTDYTVWASEGAWWGGVGFLLGFLLKNTGKYIFSAVITTGIALFILQHFGFAVINIEQLLSTLGISSLKDMNDVQLLLTDVAHNHIVGLMSITLGFMVGWKIG